MARFAPTFNPSGVFMRPEQQRRLTRFVASLVKDDRGAIARIAALTGYDRTTVSHWFAAEPEGRSYCMPYDVVPHVVDVLGSIEPLRAAAEEVGYDVVPKARPTSSATRGSCFGRVVRVPRLRRSVAMLEAWGTATLRCNVGTLL